MIVPLGLGVIREINSRLLHLVLELSEKSIHGCSTWSWCYQRNPFTIVLLDHYVIRENPVTIVPLGIGVSRQITS